MFVPDFPKPNAFESISSFAQWLEPILKCLALIAGGFAVTKWLREKNNRATDVLLKLEEEFATKCAAGRPLIDWDYDKVKKILQSDIDSGSRSHRSAPDVARQSAIDNLLRFYVVLCGVRQARQIPFAALSTCYRFWLSHYYRKNRVEFRRYINRFFPTLRTWLLADCSWWTRLKQCPFSSWWRPFFTPEHFWKADEIERDPEKLSPKES